MRCHLMSYYTRIRDKDNTAAKEDIVFTVFLLLEPLIVCLRSSHIWTTGVV